jgi:hypothetical protein
MEAQIGSRAWRLQYYVACRNSACYLAGGGKTQMLKVREGRYGLQPVHMALGYVLNLLFAETVHSSPAER